MASQTCQACGAVVQSDHVDQGQAGLWGGRMLCAVCYGQQRHGGPPIQTQPQQDEPLELVETDQSVRTPIITRVTTTAEPKQSFTRKPNVTGHGACRVRTFRAKLQAESLDFLDQFVNEWLDANPDVEIKFVTSTVGTLAGKHPEPNLILNLWY